MQIISDTVTHYESLKTKAVYAGSFDPVTNGHLWVIRESAFLFDEVTIAIGENPHKKTTFSLEDRMMLLNKLSMQFKNISVTSFDNQFLIHYARQINASHIVRGIRNIADYEYEKSMHNINSDLNAELHSEIKTIFLIPPREYIEVSSSMIKGLIGVNRWQDVVSKYVPNVVLDYLNSKYK